MNNERPHLHDPAQPPAPGSILEAMKAALEYLGGSRDTPPAGFPFRGAVWRGIWWGLLAGAILLFCGQTSKFIYIDF